MTIPDAMFERRPFFFVTALYIVALFLFLGNWGVVETSEARYAEITREMIATGDWMHPRLLNIHHYHKPPVTYWITAFGYSIFGVNSFASRFFLRVCFIVQLVLIYSITRDFFKEQKTALFATIIYGTFPLVLVSISGLTTDAYLNTAVLASVWSWVRWRITQRIYWLYALALFMGIGFLIKGPLVLVIPLLLFFGLRKFFPAVRYTIHYVIATVLCLMISLSWYLYLVHENENFIRYFLFHHTVERLTNDNAFGRHEPFWYYLAYVPLLALPWTFLFFKRFNVTTMPGIVKRIFIFWILIPLIFFSLSSSKLVLYVLSLFPGLAVFLAWMLKENEYGKALENIFLAALSMVWLAFFVPFISGTGIHANLALLIIPVLVILAFIFIRIYVKWRINKKLLLYALTFSSFLLLYAPLFMGANELKVNGTRPLSDWVIDHHLEDRNIIIYNKLLPSVAFHLNKNIITLYDGDSRVIRETQFETTVDWKDYYYDLTNREEGQRLISTLLSPSVLFVNGNIKDQAAWITTYFHHRQTIGEWTIYY